MKMASGCSFWNGIDRDKIEEICCLFALGDLSPKEKLGIDEHVRSCEECRDLIREFERIMFFDLPAVAVLRSEATVPEDPVCVSESDLLANVKERASAALERQTAQMQIEPDFSFSPPVPMLKSVSRFARAIAPVAGWAVAATFLIASLQTKAPIRGPINGTAGQSSASSQISTNELMDLRRRANDAEAQSDSLGIMLVRAEDQVRGAQLAYSKLDTQYQSLSGTLAVKESQLKQEETKLTEQEADLQLALANLNEQLAAKDSLQGQLSEVYSRLEKQRSEVARLERVAASTTANFPIAESGIDESEAKEILGARDLHIVDVYDVDRSGESSRAYGRIYYVNHSQLVFYAFDLAKLERNHKVVAFQVWGFRQPQSASAESLGLFYLENANLNRWTLRVSDPKILSRIDTLFVTVEPPGGSRSPKGKRLLMASLAGPPNHP